MAGETRADAGPAARAWARRAAGVPGLPAADRCLVMGVVNVTPDSFSDGGDWFDTGAAIVHGFDLAAQGADIVDVGGESTRPGAPRIDVDEELRRVGPVVAELAGAGVPVSVDTMRATVAQAALAAGGPPGDGGRRGPAGTRSGRSSRSWQARACRSAWTLCGPRSRRPRSRRAPGW